MSFSLPTSSTVGELRRSRLRRSKALRAWRAWRKKEGEEWGIEGFLYLLLGYWRTRQPAVLCPCSFRIE